ncbi:hypothetical protein P3G55_17310 [Leptospira sp. 96542]|nr:hypothetical protein [Leptospira sp. 96542]
MNTITIQNNQPVLPTLQAQTGKQSDQEKETRSKERELSLSLLEDSNEKTRSKEKEKVKPEDLVLKPTPIPLEERMNQIISPEEVKDLLSLITRTPLPEKKEHKVDFKR